VTLTSPPPPFRMHNPDAFWGGHDEVPPGGCNEDGSDKSLRALSVFDGPIHLPLTHTFPKFRYDLILPWTCL